MCLGSHPGECRAREWNGVWHSPSQMTGLDLVLVWTGLSRSDLGPGWWKYVHLSSPSWAPLSLLPFPSPLPLSRPGYCHTCDEGEVFQVPSDSGFPLPLVGLDLTLPTIREVSSSYHLIAGGSLPRPTLSPGHDDPYPFKRSLFGGGDYSCPWGPSLGQMYSEYVP